MRLRALPLGVYGWVLALASLLVTGCCIYCENHAIQVPLVRWINDPSLFPGDPYVAALSRYPTPLWRAAAVLARAIPLGPLLVILLVLERFFVIFAAGRLARAFAPGRDLAAVGAMALFAFAIAPLLGSGTIVEPFFEQTGLSIGFFLLAAAAFHEDRPLAWSVWLATGFTLTSLYGTFAVSYFAAAWLIDPKSRASWRRFLGAFGLFLILVSYTLVLGAASLGREPIDERLWLAASHLRGWQHLYMRAWNRIHFLEFGVVAAVVFTALGLGRRRFSRLAAHVLAWSTAAVGWLVLAYAAAYVVRWRPLLMLQPARASYLWLCFAGVASVSIAAALVEERPSRAVVALFAASFLVWRPPGWTVAAAVLAVALVIPAAWRAMLDARPRRVLAFVLAWWVCCAGLLSFRDRWAVSASVGAALVGRPEATLREVAEWARTRTPRDAVFLVNPGFTPDFDGFRALSERSIFTNWDEGTAMFWHPGSVKPWSERLRMIGFDVTHPTRDYARELDTLYASLRDLNIGVLKARLPLRYWVVSSAHPSHFPVVFENQAYKVLDLEGGDSGTLSLGGHDTTGILATTWSEEQLP